MPISDGKKIIIDHLLFHKQLEETLLLCSDEVFFLSIFFQ
jgi:hypothetical protein